MFLLIKPFRSCFSSVSSISPPKIAGQITFNKEREGRQLLIVSATSLDLSVDASSKDNGIGASTHDSRDIGFTAGQK